MLTPPPPAISSPLPSPRRQTEQCREDGVLVVRTEEDAVVDRVVKAVDVVQLPDKVAEKLVAIPHRLYQSRFVEVPGEVVEITKEVPKIVKQFNYVEAPPETRVVEVPELRTREVRHQVETVVYREEFVDQIVEVPEEQVREIARTLDVPALVPRLCERVTQYEVVVPRVVPVFQDIHVPVYVPRFVEATFPGHQEQAARANLAKFGIKDVGDLSPESAQKMMWQSLTAANRPSAAASASAVVHAPMPVL